MKTVTVNHEGLSVVVTVYCPDQEAGDDPYEVEEIVEANVPYRLLAGTVYVSLPSQTFERLCADGEWSEAVTTKAVEEARW